MTSDTIERLLTTREIATLFGLTQRQVVRLWTNGQLPGYRLGERGIVRYRASEVEAWLQERRRAS